MDRERKILVSILALLVLSAVIAIVDLSLKMQDKETGFPAKAARGGDGIGIVRIEGPILMSGTASPFGMGGGSEAIIAKLDAFQKNDNVKAVIVRINSPGGTVGATQEIYNKLWKLRNRKDKNITLIASMGDMAASGGYYIASACNEIVANYGSITGSIGVILFSPNLKRLYEKYGIKMNVIKSGPHKDLLKTHRDLTAEEEKFLQAMVDSTHSQFINDVHRGRSLSPRGKDMSQTEIEAFADGRVMNGQMAFNSKLVDVLGSFEDAIDRARELRGLPEDCPLYEEKKSGFPELLMSMQSLFRSGSFYEQNFNFNSIYRLEYRYMP
ncbi:MAG: signal peptide peptidase SppA [bacterium]|nr:signal peptide peptidase SppA [bacterium]